MNKIKKLLHDWLNSNSYDGKEWFYDDLDAPLKKNISRYLLAVVIVFVLAFASIPIVRSFSAFALFMIIGLLLLIYTLNRLKDIYSGKVIAIAGNFYKASEKKGGLKKFFSFSNKRNSLYIELDNGNYIKLYPPESFDCDEGDRIIAYVYERSLREDNRNTIIANELVAIDILEIGK